MHRYRESTQTQEIPKTVRENEIYIYVIVNYGEGGRVLELQKEVRQFPGGWKELICVNMFAGSWRKDGSQRGLWSKGLAGFLLVYHI